MGARIPHARHIGKLKLPGHRLQFHKRSPDGSGKCNAATSEQSDDHIWCAIYAMDRAGHNRLNDIEGVGQGYRLEWMDVRLQGCLQKAFIYLAQETYVDDQLSPYDWYHNYVYYGALEQGFPAAYVEAIAQAPSKQDPLQERALHHRSQLEGFR